MKKWLIGVVAILVIVLGCTFEQKIPAAPQEAVEEPAETVYFEFSGYDSNFSKTINASSELMYPNPRWNSTPIKVYIDRTNSQNYSWFEENVIEYAQLGLQDWNDATGMELFAEVDDPKEAEIKIYWETYIGTGSEGVSIGEAEPMAYDTGLFTHIVSVNVTQIPYFTSCVNRIIAQHELGHALGFGHEKDRLDIMYPYAWCYQSITEDEAETISKLYEVPGNDLGIINATIEKNGKYLDGKIKVENKGVTSIPVILSIQVDGAEIENFDLEVLQAGYTANYFFENVLAPGDYDEITLVVNEENDPEEWITENNIAVLGKV